MQSLITFQKTKCPGITVGHMEITRMQTDRLQDSAISPLSSPFYWYNNVYGLQV